MSCFSGDSKILTRNGYRDIKSLANDYGFQSPVIVWNGAKWIPAHFYITNQKIKLYNIYFTYSSVCSNKISINCTEYTTFKINNQLVNILELDGLIGPKIDKYLLPHKAPKGFIEVDIVDNARIAEIGDGGYDETYGSDADALIINDILVY